MAVSKLLKPAEDVKLIHLDIANGSINHCFCKFRMYMRYDSIIPLQESSLRKAACTEVHLTTVFIMAVLVPAKDRKWKQPVPINRGVFKEIVVHPYNITNLQK